MWIPVHCVAGAELFPESAVDLFQESAVEQLPESAVLRCLLCGCARVGTRAVEYGRVSSVATKIFTRRLGHSVENTRHQKQ